MSLPIVSAKPHVAAAICSSSAATVASTASMRFSIIWQSRAWWSVNLPSSASVSWDLGPHLSSCQVRQDVRIALASDQCGDHVPTRLAHDVGGHDSELDACVFEHGVQTLDLSCAFTEQ